MRACVRACVRAWMRARVRARARVFKKGVNCMFLVGSHCLFVVPGCAPEMLLVCDGNEFRQEDIVPLLFSPVSAQNKDTEVQLGVLKSGGRDVFIPIH